MGCFNKVGFHSHLPICSGDEIVYFICATYGVIDDITPIGSHPFIEPISLPLFGRYNEYGSVEDIEQNHYTEALEKALECNINDFIEVLEDYSFLTLKDISKRKKEKSKMSEKLNFYENILKRIFEKLCYFTKKKCKDISLCVTMEHKSVYETICNMHKHLVTDYEYEFQRIEFPSIFEETLKYINDNKIKGVNIFSTSNSEYGRKSFEMHMKGFDFFESCKNVENIKKTLDKLRCNEETLKIHKFDIVNDFATKTIYNEYSFDMMFLNILDLNYNLLKDIILDFTFFNSSLYKICGRYSLSQYGCQDLSDMYNEFKQLQDCYSNIINKLNVE